MGPLLSAAGTSAGAFALALIAGIVLAGRTHQPAWALAGFFAGILAGGAVLAGLLLRDAGPGT